jgi:hypothetical protein
VRVQSKRDWLWGLLACAPAALWADFSGMHGLHSSDTLMQPLNSLVKWTPFYWEQDRFGMLLPLLASPIRSAMPNLLAQYFAMLLAYFGVPLVLLRWVGAPNWRLGGVGTAIVLVAIVPAKFAFEMLANPYALGLVLIVLALGQAESGGWPRRGLALGLAIAATWVNAAIAPLGLALAVGKAVLLDEKPRWAPSGVVVLAGFAGWVLERRAPFRSTAMNPLLPWEWPEAWSSLGRNTALELGWVFGAVLTLAIAALIVRHRTAPFQPVELRAGLVLLVAGASYWLLVGTLKYVRLNDSVPRYIAPSLFVLTTALVGLLLARVDPWPLWSWAPSAAALCAAAALAFGAPSLSKPRALLEQAFGARTDEALALGCTHVASEYWQVWPVQFMSLVKGGPTLWAISFRSTPQKPLWAVPQPRFCAVPNDGNAATYLRDFGLGELVARRPAGLWDVLEVR